MSTLNQLTAADKQYFRSIALLNPEGDAVYVGTRPDNNNLNHFGGYYLTENNNRCGAGLKLMGNLHKDYYMDKTEWETLFGPFIYKIDEMSIEQQFKLAKSFIGTESNGGGKIISVEILSEFSPLRSQSTVKALAKNKNAIIVVLCTTRSYTFALEDHLTYLNNKFKYTTTIDGIPYSYNKDGGVIFRNDAASYTADGMAKIIDEKEKELEHLKKIQQWSDSLS